MRGIPNDEAGLTELFRKLGAADPQAWARSQVHEGIRQLARYVFLRQAWRCVVSELDSGWIRSAVDRAESHPDEPYAGVGRAAKSLIARGAAEAELTDLVRGMQAELLFGICHLLSGPDDLEPEIADMSWRLVEVDADDDVVGTIDGLHESVLETDPTGREMRPRPQA